MSPRPRSAFALTVLSASTTLTLFAALLFAATLPAQVGQAFLENRGQWDSSVRFQTHSPVGSAWFTDDGFVADMGHSEKGVVFRMHFAGRIAVARRPLDVTRLSGAHNFFRGERRITGVRGFESLRYRSVYRGVDVVARSHALAAGLFEYDVHLAPGARLRDVRIRCEGIDELSIDSAGNLVMETRAGAVVQAMPTTWETLDSGARVPRDCEFRLLDESTFGFTVAGWSGRNPLTIDPGLVLSTYVGGGGMDAFQDVVTTAKGIFVCGSSSSMNFPTNVGAYQRGLQAYTDAVVAGFKPDGTFLFGTYLGGGAGDVLNSLDVLPNGDIIAGGFTGSTDYPVTVGAMQSKLAGIHGLPDWAISKISGDGKKLLVSTFYGGSKGDDLKAVHIDGQGIVTLVGGAAAGMATTKGAYQTKCPSTRSSSPFVARFKKDLKTLIYATWVGGTNFGQAWAVDVGGNAEVTIAGQEGSTDFPTTKGAFQTAFSGKAGFNTAGFVARLDVRGSKLLWATFLSGNLIDRVTNLHLHRDGRVTVAGWTMSRNFPVTLRSYQPVFNGPIMTGAIGFRGDGFISRLGREGRVLQASTMLGGTGPDELIGLDVDGAGNVTVTGSTGSKDFPITAGAYQSTFVNPGFPTHNSEAFVSRLDPSLSDLLYSSYLGGSYTEIGIGVAVDPQRLVATLIGSTGSKNFPVSAKAFQKKLLGRSSGYVTQIELLPKGSKNLGASSPCDGATTLEPIGAAKTNDKNFRIALTGAAAKTSGLLVVSPMALNKPITLGPPLGGLLIVAPGGAVLIPIKSDSLGTATMKFDLTGIKAGATGYLQAVWANTFGACQTSDFVSTSNGLQLTVQ